jgi:hypothetical protein
VATITIGTAATTTLTGAVWHSNMAQADVRAINTAILNDLNLRHPQAQIDGGGGFVREGLLYVPNRGPLQLYDGDIVAVDARGGVILVTKYSAAGANWVHT